MNDDLKRRFPRFLAHQPNPVEIEYAQRYLAAAHAVQSGVKMVLQLEEDTLLSQIEQLQSRFPGQQVPDAAMNQLHRAMVDQSTGGPKHLRVGVDLRASDVRALTTLLIEKGIITWEEVTQASAEALELEAAEYEARLTQRMGMPVKLG